MSSGRVLGCVAIAGAALLLARPARATYSIIGTDPTTGELGAAGASCVPYEVIQIHGNVPGRGAFVAQANFDDAAFEEALELFEGGASAGDVLDRVTDAGAFPNAPFMQYGTVDVHGGIDRFTGPDAMPVAIDVEASFDDMRFAALGNVLTSREVVDTAANAVASSGCDLADKLVLALEAAGRGGEGDSRCTPEGRPANSAFLEVSDAAGTRVRISIPDVSPNDPVEALRAEYDVWREAHPCRVAPPEENEGGGGGSTTSHDPPPPSGCSASESAGRHEWPAAIALALFVSACPRARSKRCRRPAGSRSGT